MCARDGDLLALAPVLFVFAFVTRNAFSQSQSSAGRPARLCRTEILARPAGPRAGSARTMAAQPPRPPPNNLLFCGPPPDLPRVVLFPSDANRDTCNLDASSDTVLSQTNDADALNEINNVGIPTYENQEELIEFRNDITENRLQQENYLRRTHSIDISDLSGSSTNIDLNSCRLARSEPDLSKYGLFLEAEVTVEPFGPQQPAPLVLNNPFYDGSYALNPTQLNNGIVVLPENYLAFEDSFVPTFDYKPDLLVDNFNPDLYYDGLPIVPPNDPWSVYGADNSVYNYYSPQYETPMVDQDAIQYMPLTDLQYAIPQYMSLPVVEQAKLETFIDNNSNKFENNNRHNFENASAVTSNVTQETADSVVLSNDDEKVIGVEHSNRESSTQSEESLNGDISNDITSSLAFVPSSKYSPQRLQGIAADDTSNDTSPCSTDYHEASALDIVQSHDELSCCDSDYSQSRDDTSPAPPDLSKVLPTVPCEVTKGQSEISGSQLAPSNTPLGNLPLSKLPSIPLHDTLPTKLPPVPSELVLAENTKTDQSKVTPVNSTENVPEPNKCSQIKTNQTLDLLKYDESNVKVNTDSTLIRQPPQPPAVPPSWLPKKPPCDVTRNSTQSAPQINVQNVEGQTITTDRSPKSTHKPVVANQKQEEPQPSCSYAAPRLPAPVSQLKPDKQPKDVEVS